MKLFPDLSEEDFETAWKKIDKDGDGNLSMAELAEHYGFDLSNDGQLEQRRAAKNTKAPGPEEMTAEVVGAVRGPPPRRTPHHRSSRSTRRSACAGPPVASLAGQGGPRRGHGALRAGPQRPDRGGPQPHLERRRGRGRAVCPREQQCAPATSLALSLAPPPDGLFTPAPRPGAAAAAG